MSSRALQLTPLLLAALALGTLGTLARLPATERFLEAETYEDVYYLPSPEWLRAFSLGYTEALADLVWIRTLVYYGDELAHRGGERHVLDYANAIVTLDPDMRAAYGTIGTLAVYRAQDVTAEDVESAVAFMERGAQRFPDDGALAWRTGATLAFELPPLYRDRPDLALRARERAAPYLVRAVELRAAPPYAMFSNASLLTRIGRTEEAARHLEQVYSMTTDPDQRAEIAAHIEHLRSASFSTAFVDENERFEQRWGREMPYAPAALYDLVGPVPPLDATATLRDGFGSLVVGDAPFIE